MTTEFTGERYMPSIAGEIRHEHLHRYAFSLRFVVDKVVLDVACGEGYGSALLATRARQVVGADISVEVVEEARKTYAKRRNLEFLPCDAVSLPFADRSFDAVVSFETIEHHDRHEEMLAECARVLRPGGLLILSSPNKKVYSDDSGYRNEFHVKELYFDEFDGLMKRHFRHVKYLGQRLATGSVIYPLDAGASGAATVWADDGSETRGGVPQLEAPVYFLALATQSRALITTAGSVLISQADDLYAEFKKVAKWASGLHGELIAAQTGARQALDLSREAQGSQQQRALEELVEVQQALQVAESRASDVARDAAAQFARAQDEARRDVEILTSRLRELAADRSALGEKLLASAVERAALVEELRQTSARLERAEARVVATREAFEQHQREVADQAVARQLEQDERVEEIRLQCAALQEAFELGQTSLATQREEIAALEHSVQGLENERQVAMFVAQQELFRHNTELAQSLSREQQLQDQLAASELQATRRNEALQGELLDSQRRARSANAQTSARLERAEARVVATREAFEQHQREVADQAVARQLEQDERVEEIRLQCAALQEAFELGQTSLATQREEIAALEHSVQGLENERQVAMFVAQQELFRHNTELAQSLSREQQLQDQLAASELQATRRNEALQGELLDSQRRARSADANYSLKIIELTQALGAQRAQLALLAQCAQQALESPWWRVAAPIRHLADSLLGGSLRADANAMRIAVAETHALDLTHPFDLARFSTTSHESPRNSFMNLTNLQPSAGSSSVNDLLSLDGARFVEQAYIAILGREPDREGLAHYLELLANGDEKVELLSHLHHSDEGKQKQLSVTGLDAALKNLRLSKLPLVGSIFLRRLRAPARQTGPSNIGAREGGAESDSEDIKRLRRQIEAMADGAALQAEIICMAQSLSVCREVLEFDVFGTARALLRGHDSEFMNLLYRVALQREPLPHERSHYTKLLAEGASRQHIADIVLRSTEFRALSGPVVTVDSPRRETLPPARSPGPRFGARPLPDGGTGLPALPHYKHPVVSVIVPVYGKLNYTLQCLRSIASHLPKVPFEVIVVDDCSPDDTVSVLLKVQGVRLVRNLQNMGFIRSCNQGALEATGEYLCFLNNDTEVQPGWLDELVRTFAIFPGTGFAGSKLIYPDGSLQEAGGILWQDGSAWNFGRGQSPDLPEFNYAREVDYCSGASIMVPAALFAELGGFDEHYAPAYCEDSDLALKIRECGHRVIYQPMSVVVHHEGITSGTDTGHGTKAYQVANSKKLYERWKRRLATHQPNAINVDNAKDRRMKRRVLVLEHCTPTPDQDAGSVSVFNMLLLLREMDFQVTFIAEDNFLYMPDYTVMLQRAGIEVLYAPYTSSVVQHVQAVGGRYDLVYLFRPVVVERHIEAVRTFCPQAKVLFYTHDIHYIRMEREARLLTSPQRALEAAEMKAREFKAIRAVDSTIVVSTAEMEILRPQLGDQDLQILPLLLDIPGTQAPFDGREGIVFVGSYQHPPNVDAVQYFVGDVLPLLRGLLPGVRFRVVGSKPPQVITALAAPDVEIVGFVEDLKPLLDRMRLSVAPLRYGAGVKGKVGTALAHGLPTVVTSMAAEGMSVVDGEHVLFGDTPEEIADAIARLYRDPLIWNRLSREGVEYAERSWGPSATFKTFGEIISNLGFPVHSPIFPLKMFTAGVFGHIPQAVKSEAEHRPPSNLKNNQLLVTHAFNSRPQVRSTLARSHT